MWYFQGIVNPANGVDEVFCCYSYAYVLRSSAVLCFYDGVCPASNNCLYVTAMVNASLARSRYSDAVVQKNQWVDVSDMSTYRPAKYREK